MMRAPKYAELVSAAHGDQRRSELLFRCDRCAKTLSVPFKSKNPQIHSIVLRNAGWSSNSRLSKIACAECSAPETPNGTVIIMPSPDPILPTPSARVLPTPSGTPLMPPRDPTSEQRLAIRTELDAHFDDAMGMYLADTSDASIAEKLHIPRAWVEQIREVGYGAIRITPDMRSLRKDLEQVTRDFDAKAKALIDETRKQCDLQHAAMQTLMRRMEAIERKG